MKSILITGGAGFIGSNFLTYFLDQYSEYRLINLDLLTYAGDLENLKDLEHEKRYSFVHGDICNKELLSHLFSHHDIRGVVHLAAESHVDNSIKDPGAFVRTNVEGTFALLDAARKHWLDAPFALKKGYEDCRFLHVSTDEVYGSLGETGFFTEKTRYAPNSPYSASKASSDFLVRSYFHTYGLPVLTSNCSNNFGPRQHDEKLIPTIIRKATARQPIPIYGNGKNVRDWLYVIDHAKALDSIFHKGKLGETYIIGTRNERTNIELARYICRLLDKLAPHQAGSYSDLIAFVEDRPGHDHRYAIDPAKLEGELGWKAELDFESALQETIQWYLNKYQIINTKVTKEAPTTDKPQKEVKKDKNKENLVQEQPSQASQNTENTAEDFVEEVEAEEVVAEEVVEETLHTRKRSSEKTQQEPPNPYAQDYSRYANFLSQEDLEEALEGLAEIKASLIRARKNYESAQENDKDAESKAIMIMRKAEKGEIAWEEANKLAMQLLRKQEQAQEEVRTTKKHIAELENLHSKMEQHVDTIKNARKAYRKKVRMPDSSDTIDMIERMKAKVEKDEILSDLYEQIRRAGPDPELERKVNDALGVDAQKEALKDLKKKLGLD
ncbi:MAG: dTDP-glucose 4,6-dehydratase [Bernardetiaceae bacterium]|nr:dTDP-glucose 4,6-dehydratase [Bernardetiaceae bacterium]